MTAAIASAEAELDQLPLFHARRPSVSHRRAAFKFGSRGQCWGPGALNGRCQWLEAVSPRLRNQSA
jgi:hypothetical protein